MWLDARNQRPPAAPGRGRKGTGCIQRWRRRAFRVRGSWRGDDRDALLGEIVSAPLPDVGAGVQVRASARYSGSEDPDREMRRTVSHSVVRRQITAAPPDPPTPARAWIMGACLSSRPSPSSDPRS